ncbi:hypothetical protein [Pedobacter rhodius]|uniref:Uncharacterized protein n=1 Tax=Pedobacter rhodius TaxID=3004098 RepID=A0ABT4KSQ1_9SPHI|nr:hypothetical protein [Pedobacter sp. SJ11]MCZ4221940.1 hypothetical protein [Pedobacter sp. SJ11]
MKTIISILLFYLVTQTSSAQNRIQIFVNNIPQIITSEKIRLHHNDVIEFRESYNPKSKVDTLTIRGCAVYQKKIREWFPKKGTQEQQELTKPSKSEKIYKFPPFIKKDYMSYKFELNAVSDCPGRKITAILEAKIYNFYYVK